MINATKTICALECQLKLAVEPCMNSLCLISGFILRVDTSTVTNQEMGTLCECKLSELWILFNNSYNIIEKQRVAMSMDKPNLTAFIGRV